MEQADRAADRKVGEHDWRKYVASLKCIAWIRVPEAEDYCRLFAFACAGSPRHSPLSCHFHGFNSAANLYACNTSPKDCISVH